MVTTTVLVGDDTDLIVLLCFYVDREAHDLFMYSQSKSSSHISRVWNIKSVREKLGCNVCLCIFMLLDAVHCYVVDGNVSPGRPKSVYMGQQNS